MSYLKLFFAFLGLVFGAVVALTLRDKGLFKLASAELKEARADHKRAKAESAKLRWTEAAAAKEAARYQHLAHKEGAKAAKLEGEIDYAIKDLPDSVRVQRLRARLAERERGGSG